MSTELVSYSVQQVLENRRSVKYIPVVSMDV